MAGAEEADAGARADRHASASTPAQVVERFLELLRSGDIDEATELLATDVEYENVSLPTMHGRERIRRLFQAGIDRGGGFDFCMHAISYDGQSVLTERTDVLELRRLRVQLWVCGRFDVRDGQIVLWRDYFDWMNFTVATVRGVLGLLRPGGRAAP